MRILVLTNLFPPHTVNSNDVRCEHVTRLLKLRGHQTLVLTSMHGMKSEQRDSEVERRLQINGAFGDPLVTKYSAMKAIEQHNHDALRDVIARFQPDVIYVFSLEGLSKSLIFTLRNSRRPTIYDVSDHWISAEVAMDPWLRFWNAPSLSFLEQSVRTALEMSGERGRLDGVVPTRMGKGYDRLPGLYGSPKERGALEPNSLPTFRFDRIFFCSESLKLLTENAGFVVRHADIIHPGIPAADYIGEVKPAGAFITKLLVAAPLRMENGIMTAITAVKLLRDCKVKVTLTVCGRGDTRYIAGLRSFVVTNQLPVEFITVSNLVKDMPAVYRKHDAFLHTAEWAEPFPVGPLEAMACGLPVVGSLSGGAAELLRHGENALVYSPGDAAELAARIQELQLSPALRVQMTETAQAEVLSRFNESTVIDQIENYLNTSMEIWAHTAT